MAHIKICKEPDCHNAATTKGFCRLHYLKNWRRLKADEDARAANKLNQYVEGVIRRHPERYLEVIKEDLLNKAVDVMVDEVSEEEDAEAEAEEILHEPTYDEEVDELIKRLKIEKGF